MAEQQFNQTSHAVFITTGHSEPVPAQSLPPKQSIGELKIAWKRGGMVVAGIAAAILIIGMLVAVKLASQQQTVETKAFGVR